MQLTRVGVVGIGTMGQGITQVTAQAGLEVVVRAKTQPALDASLDRIEKAYGKLTAKGKLSVEQAEQAFSRITGTTTYQDLADCDLVIEAVAEDLVAKQDVWRALDPLLRPETVCASNTSSLAVIDQASVTARAGHFVGLHFFNPVPVMRLLEVVRTVATEHKAHALAMEFGARIGKDVVQTQDRAGFIVNRLLLPYTMDAVRILENGFGTIAGIDTAMRGGVGYPMGPFTLLDFVGLDISLTMADAMYREYREQRFVAPPTLRKLVAAGHLGQKTGRGFYDYSGERPVPADLGLFPA